jgi:TPR repeat protein
MAQYEIAERYYFGYDGPGDNQKAREFCFKAVEQGNTEAQHAIGFMWLNAKRWHRWAADRGLA